MHFETWEQKETAMTDLPQPINQLLRIMTINTSQEKGVVRCARLPLHTYSSRYVATQSPGLASKASYSLPLQVTCPFCQTRLSGHQVVCVSEREQMTVPEIVPRTTERKPRSAFL